MDTQAPVKIHTARRRLTDLYRLQGYQTLAGVTAHPVRPNALVVRLRRLKKPGYAHVTTDCPGNGMITKRSLSGLPLARALKSGSSTRSDA